MTLASYLQDFEASAANGGGRPEWLTPIKRGAIDRFEALGFPDRNDEDWKFTSVAPIARTAFGRMAPGDTLPTEADLEPYLIGPPEWPRVSGSARVRSGLNTSHELPPSVVFHSRFDDTYRTLSSIGEKMIGKVHCQRSTMSDAGSPE